jgi:hypothetical protein
MPRNYKRFQNNLKVSCGWEAVKSRTQSCHGKELWGFSCEVLTDVEDIMCYNYSNFSSVIIDCIYDWWISNKSTHQSKPRLLVTIVTNTCDITFYGISAGEKVIVLTEGWLVTSVLDYNQACSHYVFHLFNVASSTAHVGTKLLAL